MIEPTIGRVVLFHPAPEVTHAAIVCHVWSSTCINLCVFNSNGIPQSETSVFLFQGEGERPSHKFAEWMPYQKGQAAKTEQLEKLLKEA